ITKHGFLVKDISHLEKTLAEAFRIARSDRPGPVIVDIPKDVQIAETEFFGGLPLPDKPHRQPDPVALQAAADMINAAERPYIYAGGGVLLADSSELMCELAEKLDAPVGLSLMGMSAMSCDHPLYLGLTGMHGLPEATQIKAEADLIIGIGVRFSDRATGNIVRYQEKVKILHLDIDDVEIDKNVTATASLIGDLRDVLPQLISLVNKKDRSQWRARAISFKAAMREAAIENGNSNNGFLAPQALIHTIRRLTDDSTVVVTDVGQHQMWVAQYYGFMRPRTFLTSGGLGTMGFGMGAAVGASIAMGNAKTLLFTSDGSFHMNMAEFATAVRFELPITVVLLNNSVLGMVRQWQSLFYGERYAETTLDRPTDYVKLAEALGGTGFRVGSFDELASAYSSASGYQGPVLIECPISRDASVYPIIPPGGSFNDMIIG
ncbi:MAG: acetolactate synthase large subunit, partial [Coriobacteriales bacterium]|nr:acetolactate synthase large subunit [Coriobacteriales bacterium]